MHTKQNAPFLQIFPHKHLPPKPLPHPHNSPHTQLPSSVKNHGGDRFQGKSLDADQGLPRSDWAGVLPTQKFLNSNLVTPEKFLQFGPSIQKLFMIFLITDRWMDGQTHKLHAKQITPLPYTGMGGKLFIPHFFYLSQNGVSK